ncbi:MAG: chemotaxis protein CheB [Pseudomonadota bacterium]
MAICLRVGLIAVDSEQPDKLCQLLEQNDVDVVCRIQPSVVNSHTIKETQVDVWIIDVGDDDWCDSLDELVETSTAPLFFNEPTAIHQQQHAKFWVENLIARLMKMAGLDPDAMPLHGEETLDNLPDQAPPDLATTLPERIATNEAFIPIHQPITQKPLTTSAHAQAYRDKTTRVWVLGASLGGPAAVKQFIQSLSADVNVAFILVQHIDKNFLKSLASVLSPETGIDIKLLESSHHIRHGQLLIAPADYKLSVSPGGFIASSDQNWSSPYAPNIDDVLFDIANAFELTGAIIFSGMGDDSVAGCQYYKKLQRPVWLQDNETCASNSMPQAVAEKCEVDFIGTPKELAKKLEDFVTEQDKTMNKQR